MVDKIVRRGHPNGRHCSGTIWEVAGRGRAEHRKPPLLVRFASTVKATVADIFRPLNALGMYSLFGE